MRKIIAIAELPYEILVCNVRTIDFIKSLFTFDDHVRVTPRFGFRLDDKKHYALTFDTDTEPSFIKLDVINFRVMEEDYFKLYIELSKKLNKRG